MPLANQIFGCYGNITRCCKSYHKATVTFSSNPRISFSRKSTRKDPPWKVTKTKQFLSTWYGDPSATEVPPCCEATSKKLINVLHYISVTAVKCTVVPVQGTIFRRQKNPRRGPKIAGIVFVCNEPGRSIPYCAQKQLCIWLTALRDSIGPIACSVIAG